MCFQELRRGHILEGEGMIGIIQFTLEEIHVREAWRHKLYKHHRKPASVEFYFNKEVCDEKKVNNSGQPSRIS